MDSKEIFTRFAHLSVLHKTLVYLALIFVACGAYWYFVLDDNLIKITRMGTEIEQLDKDIALFQARVANAHNIEEELNRAKKEMYFATTLLPEDAQALENLLASFEKLGRDENVEFIFFQPGAEQKFDFYATRTVSLQISGTFHRLMTYFDRLSRLNRLVSIQSVTFAPVSDFSPTEKYLNANLSLLVYRSLTEAEIKALEAQKQQK
ncbi:hypothetical protein MASR1M90_13570 [Desulfovibrionales bacterium]